MIKLNNLSLMRGTKTLFDAVSLTLFAKQKIGLVGANGSGKSSLFAMLLKEIEPNDGELNIDRHVRVAHVEQETPSLSISAIDFAIRGDKVVHDINQEIEKANQNEDFHALAELHGRLEEADGYRVASKGAQILSGLGFPEAQQKLSVSEFSGGWRMRLNLAQALMCPSDLLLLDEPTNHLDLDAILWVEKWLSQYPGTLIVISHDRDFLDKVIDHIVHIENQTVKFYKGNYSSFEKQRATQLALHQAMHDKQQKHIKHMMKFVDKFRFKASKAKQAQSRLKSIEKLEVIAATSVNSPFNFEFMPLDRIPNPMITTQAMTLGYDQTEILKNINFQIRAGDRIGLLGRNGAGKSTLIKGLMGELNPFSGDVTRTKNLSIGYFAQHQVDTLKLENSPLEQFQAIANNASTSELRKFLGGFGFQGDMALAPAINFSGGERARLALALIVWKRPQLLLLDEPTNHLDLDMRNAMSLALQSFDGALLLVSHDRYLLESSVDKLYLIKDKSLNEMEGDLDDYEKFILTELKTEKQEARTQAKQSKIQSTKKVNPQKIAKLEKEMAKLQEKLDEITEQINDPSLFEKIKLDKRETFFTEQKQLQDELERVEQVWFDANER